MGMIPIDKAYLKAEKLFDMVRNADDDHEVVLAIAQALRTSIGDGVEPVQLRVALFCCDCGKRLEPNTFQMCGLFKLRNGSAAVVQTLVWCVDCWAKKWVHTPKQCDSDL